MLAPLKMPSATARDAGLESSVVRTPTSFHAAFEQMRDGGWTALDCDPEYGGQGMPYVRSGMAAGEMFSASNMAFTMYRGLTHGAYSAIHAHGSGRAKGDVPARMVTCEWTGTMNLTGRIPAPIWASCAPGRTPGRWQLSDHRAKIASSRPAITTCRKNVIHLVLAKAPAAARAPKGHLAVHRAEVSGERRWQPWRAQRRQRRQS